MFLPSVPPRRLLRLPLAVFAALGPFSRERALFWFSARPPPGHAGPDAARSPRFMECAARGPQGLPGRATGSPRCFQDLRLPRFSSPLAEGLKQMPPVSLAPPLTSSWVAARAWLSSQAPPSGPSHRSLGPLLRGQRRHRARSPRSSFLLPYRG
ncbi:hypothetical protein NDU88_001451 [Pleurodeles waltl]|uniref:Secreted protein n=1 Tax=Pleurodeles waltl TaxID=8319 RepID=A0AAV7LZC9_PLEWA|nr:hypothetical protein NDU88_001451 [Pleurodeles waltl]